MPNPCGNDAGEARPSISHEEEKRVSDNWIEWRAVPVGYRCRLLVGISAGYVMFKTERPEMVGENGSAGNNQNNKPTKEV